MTVCAHVCCNWNVREPSAPNSVFTVPFFQLTEDLRSVDSPASLRVASSPAGRTLRAVSLPAGHSDPIASSQDVSISVSPPSPQQRVGESGDSVEEVGAADNGDIIVKQEASKQHVFAKVVLNSQEEQSETEGGKGAGESYTDDSAVTEKDKDGTSVVRDLPGMQSASVDSTSSTASTRRHLWGEAGKGSLLKLKIPKRASEDEVDPSDPTDSPAADGVDRLEVSMESDTCHLENGRIRSSSDTSNVSKNSESDLITKAEAPESRQHPPPSAKPTQGAGSGGSSSRDVLDFKGAASVLKVLQRKSRLEENNNQGRTSSSSDGPLSADSLARRYLDRCTAGL